MFKVYSTRWGRIGAGIPAISSAIVASAFSLGAAHAESVYFSGSDNRRAFSRAGHGDVSITYQHIHTNGLEDNTGFHPVGKTDTHAMEFEINYALTDRWSVNLAIPFVQKRFSGPGRHDPSLLIPPQNSEFVDDGAYHGGLQDIHVGARYLALDGPLKIEPFVIFSFPASDYPFFAASAIGQHRMKLEAGSSFYYLPSLDDYFFTLSASRVLVERTLGRDVDHWRVNAGAGYFFTPNFAVQGLLLVKQGGGLETPDDFTNRTDELWFHHDQLVQHNQINAGVGLNWLVDDKLNVSAAAFRAIHSDVVFVLKYAFSLTLTRSF